MCSNKDLDGQCLNIPYDKWVAYNSRTQVWYNSDGKKIPEILKNLSAWQPDIFFINGIFSPYYNFLPILFGKATKKIISVRGMLHEGALSQKPTKKRIYLGLWKLIGLHKRNSFHATNAEEESFIKAVFGEKTSVYQAANLPRALQSDTSLLKQKNFLELVSIGLISPMKNYYEVLKALKRCNAEIHYMIYGPVKDPVYWQQCCELIKTMPTNISVQYKGDLPSVRVPEALQKGHVFVLPSKSENFGHAIFEALTAGLPVITSHGTPWNDLQTARAGMNVDPKNDYELSEAICFFAAADGPELEHWSVGARTYAANAIDIESIQDQYRQMFQL